MEMKMSIPRDLVELHPGLGKWSILTCYRGSIVHGMYIPSNDPNSVDDKDAMAVCVPPLEYYFGLKNYGSKGTKEIKRDEWDIVTYEAKKFIRLLSKGNPNVLMALWLEPNYYIKLTAWCQARTHGSKEKGTDGEVRL
jgi:predicted nucleotidyltransferase